MESTLNSIDPTHIRLAYYESSSEPRIMLFGPQSVDLKALKCCFQRLGGGESQIDFHELPFVFVAGGIRLRLCSIRGIAKEVSNGLQQGLLRIDGELRSFEWKRTKEGWDYLAELLDGLIAAKQPGHQYMTRYPEEDAIVVVSKGEYDDSVMTA